MEVLSHMVGRSVFGKHTIGSMNVSPLKCYIESLACIGLKQIICDPAPLNEALWVDYKNQKW